MRPTYHERSSHGHDYTLAGKADGDDERPVPCRAPRRRRRGCHDGEWQRRVRVRVHVELVCAPESAAELALLSAAVGGGPASVGGLSPCPRRFSLQYRPEDGGHG